MFVKKNIGVLLTLLAVIFYSAVALGQPKGDIVICQGAEITSLDPARHSSIIDMTYSLEVFEMLYYRDPQGTPQPRLALSHRLINDTTWEFKLRKGVKFHNNAAMTAQDVKFSIDRIIDPQLKFFFGPYYSVIKEAKVVDESTIQIVTKFPDPLLLKRLSLYALIFPSDLFKEKGAEAFFQHPVGTGPFKFVSWARNDRLVLEANEAYWDGVPKVKRLIIRPVPEASTRVAELLTGNADIITNRPPFLIPQVKDSPLATIQSVSSGRVMYAYLNCLAEGPLKDKRVRQALNYAVDKNAIVESVLKGSGVPMAANISPYHFGYDASLKPYPYDPAKAKKLLAEAGYGSGLKLTVNTSSGRFLLDKEVAEAIAGMLTAVGIEVDFKVLEWGTYVQSIIGKKLQDIGFIGWANALHDADGTYQPLFTSGSPSSYYSTPELTEKINKARSTMDEKKRLELYKEIQREIYEEAPLLFLYQQIDHYGVSRKLKDFQVRGDEQFVVYKATKQ